MKNARALRVWCALCHGWALGGVIAAHWLPWVAERMRLGRRDSRHADPVGDAAMTCDNCSALEGMIRANQRAAEANLLKSEHFYDALYERLAERVKRLETSCQPTTTAETSGAPRAGACTKGVGPEPSRSSSTDFGSLRSSDSSGSDGGIRCALDSGGKDAGIGGIACDPIAAMDAAWDEFDRTSVPFVPDPLFGYQGREVAIFAPKIERAIRAERLWPAVKAEVERLRALNHNMGEGRTGWPVVHQMQRERDALRKEIESERAHSQAGYDAIATAHRAGHMMHAAVVDWQQSCHARRASQESS